MRRRFQIVESMLWRPPAGVDAESVRFHIAHPGAAGAAPTQVIAEWLEPDPCAGDEASSDDRHLLSA